MNLKKPKFWDYKKPNIHAYILYPLTILIKIISFFILSLGKKIGRKLKLKQFVLETYILVELVKLP